MKSKTTNLISLFNYFCMLSLLIMMLMLQFDYYSSSTLGVIMTSVLILCFLVNFLLILLTVLIKTIKLFSKCCNKSNKIKRMKKIRVEPSNGSDI